MKYALLLFMVASSIWLMALGLDAGLLLPAGLLACGAVPCAVMMADRKVGL